MHNHNYFRVQKFQNMKFEKFSLENCLWKFQKNLEVSYLTRGTICQKWDTRRPPGTKMGCPTRPDSLAAWDPPTLSPGGVRWVSYAHLLPLDRKPLPGIFPKFSRARSSCYPWISKFRADFSNLFGGIAPWYVTPPPIQLFFVFVPHVWSILLH